MQDFEFLEEVDFPSRGTTITPSHQHGDFRFQSIAPIGMRFFRDIFGISVESFLNSIAAEPLGKLTFENLYSGSRVFRPYIVWSELKVWRTLLSYQ